MNTAIICQKCGTGLEGQAVAGLCPRCLARFNLETESGDASGAVRAAPLAPEEIASRFPQLEILQCLGRGGMGVVYKARQPRLDRWVALKILAPEKAKDVLFAERFSREAKALAHLSHPNIVTVHDFGETGGLYYLIMEFVDGVDLRQLLRQGRLSPEQALEIVPAICDALQFAHSQGVVHRDIKPENILLDAQGRVKIADFGIAKILGEPAARESLTEAKQVIGTPHYMAPEQVEHPAKVDHRADIFSLGVVFYEMLTGELPLGKFSPPSRKVQVDVRLDEIVLHALEKEPERRYQHASDVKVDVAGLAVSPEQRHKRKTWSEALRWTARFLGTAQVLFFGVFLVAEGLPAIASQPHGVQIGFAALGLILAGMIAGWTREGTAALLILWGEVLWHVAEGSVSLSAFLAPLPVGLIYAWYWWLHRGRRTIRALVLAGAMVAALIAGMLLLPTNVWISGTVRNAATGQPVEGARLTLQGPRESSTEVRHGRYQILVGWYKPALNLEITANGYEPISTNLGPRSFGNRRTNRDFELRPLPTRTLISMPAVVTESFPVSGSVGVDPTLQEITVTFSKAMDKRKRTYLSGSQLPRITGAITFSPDGRTATIPVQLETNRTYLIEVNPGHYVNFHDLQLNPALPWQLVFSTRTNL